MDDDESRDLRHGRLPGARGRRRSARRSPSDLYTVGAHAGRADLRLPGLPATSSSTACPTRTRSPVLPAVRVLLPAAAPGHRPRPGTPVRVRGGDGRPADRRAARGRRDRRPAAPARAVHPVRPRTAGGRRRRGPARGQRGARSSRRTRRRRRRAAGAAGGPGRPGRRRTRRARHVDRPSSRGPGRGRRRARRARRRRSPSRPRSCCALSGADRDRRPGQRLADAGRPGRRRRRRLAGGLVPRPAGAGRGDARGRARPASTRSTTRCPASPRPSSRWRSPPRCRRPGHAAKYYQLVWTPRPGLRQRRVRPGPGCCCGPATGPARCRAGVGAGASIHYVAARVAAVRIRLSPPADEACVADDLREAGARLRPARRWTPTARAAARHRGAAGRARRVRRGRPAAARRAASCSAAS